MKHIIPLHRGNLNKEDKMIQRGCGECQSSCQSACKTSCTVANQVCAKEESKGL